MRAAPTLDAKTSTRFAEPPWSEHSEPWLELDAQLPPDHLARDIRGALAHLNLTPLYLTVWRAGQSLPPAGPHVGDCVL